MFLDEMPFDTESADHRVPFSDEEERRLLVLFNQLDVNRDGRIDVNDLSKALQQLQIPHVPGHAQVTNI